MKFYPCFINEKPGDLFLVELQWLVSWVRSVKVSQDGMMDTRHVVSLGVLVKAVTGSGKG